MNEMVIYNLVADALSRIVGDGVKISSISHQTGLSSSTLYKFMRQDTLYPRFHTVMCVLDYLGYTINISKGDYHGVRPKHFQNQPAASRLL
jgi:DNA-binding phage protein